MFNDVVTWEQVVFREAGEGNGVMNEDDEVANWVVYGRVTAMGVTTGIVYVSVY